MTFSVGDTQKRVIFALGGLTITAASCCTLILLTGTVLLLALVLLLTPLLFISTNLRHLEIYEPCDSNLVVDIQVELHYPGLLSFFFHEINVDIVHLGTGTKIGAFTLKDIPLPSVFSGATLVEQNGVNVAISNEDLLRMSIQELIENGTMNVGVSVAQVDGRPVPPISYSLDTSKDSTTESSAGHTPLFSLRTICLNTSEYENGEPDDDPIDGPIAIELQFALDVSLPVTLHLPALRFNISSPDFPAGTGIPIDLASSIVSPGNLSSIRLNLSISEPQLGLAQFFIASQISSARPNGTFIHISSAISPQQNECLLQRLLDNTELILNAANPDAQPNSNVPSYGLQGTRIAIVDEYGIGIPLPCFIWCSSADSGQALHYTIQAEDILVKFGINLQFDERIGRFLRSGSNFTFSVRSVDQDSAALISTVALHFYGPTLFPPSFLIDESELLPHMLSEVALSDQLLLFDVLSAILLNSSSALLSVRGSGPGILPQLLAYDISVAANSSALTTVGSYPFGRSGDTTNVLIVSASTPNTLDLRYTANFSSIFGEATLDFADFVDAEISFSGSLVAFVSIGRTGGQRVRIIPDQNFINIDLRLTKEENEDHFVAFFSQFVFNTGVDLNISGQFLRQNTTPAAVSFERSYPHFRIPSFSNGASSFIRNVQIQKIEFTSTPSLFSDACGVTISVGIELENPLPFDVVLEQIHFEIYFNDSDGFQLGFISIFPMDNVLMANISESSTSSVPSSVVPLVITSQHIVPVVMPIPIATKDACLRLFDEHVIHEQLQFIDIRSGIGELEIENFSSKFLFELLRVDILAQ